MDKKSKNEKNILIAEEILLRNSDKVNKFLEIAFRKVTNLDEYGDENSKALTEELSRFLKKLSELESLLMVADDSTSICHSIFNKKKIDLMKFGQDSIAGNCAKILNQKFNNYYLFQKNKFSDLSNDDMSKMNGAEFEQYIIQQLKKCGITDAVGTTATGDQGADILFSHNGKRVVIQAKRYSSTVGNGAVQEVHAAKGFYSCDIAWVITNSTYTTSAQELANRLNVVLIDGKDLARFETKIFEHLK